MTSIADFTLPAPELPLGALFDRRPEATVELDCVVPSGDTVVPHFWVHDAAGDMDAVREALLSIPELRSADLLVDLGDRGLFGSEWAPEHMGVMSAVAASGVTVLSASGSRDGWRFEVRAAELDQLATFQEYCTENHVTVTLTRVSRLTATSSDSEYGLTPEQYEALALAYERGYYDDPRAVDQADLAAELGISRQAFASRLRRGYRVLIESTIGADILSST